MLYVYGTKEQIIIVNVLLFVVMGLAFAFKDIFLIFFENFLQGGVEDMNSFSSGRIQLYKDAIEIFKKYPVFGAGWTTFEAENVNRIQVFHSTIFHTLAISGIFGLISVFIFTVACFTTILKKLNKNVLLLGVPWTITMLHGLIDNTIHMVIYTLLTMVVFTAIRKEEEIIV
jgi:O-antigen ligase